MKIIKLTLSILVLCLTGLTCGCIGNGPANSNQAIAANSQSNANRSADSSVSAQPSGIDTTSPQSSVRRMPGSPEPSSNTQSPGENRPPPTLLGTYSVVEVHHKGVIDMISADNTTRIDFLPDGRFTRESKKGGQVDHTDAGEFRVEGQDELVLVIRESKQKIVDPPVVRKHKIQISADGTEIRMMSKDGKTAMFRRTTPLPGR